MAYTTCGLYSKLIAIVMSIISDATISSITLRDVVYEHHDECNVYIESSNMTVIVLKTVASLTTVVEATSLSKKACQGQALKLFHSRK